MGAKSFVASSPNKFKVEKDELKLGSDVGTIVTKLEKLRAMKEVANVGVKVEIKGKIADMKGPEEIKGKDKVYMKQECVFSDGNGEAYRLVERDKHFRD